MQINLDVCTHYLGKEIEMSYTLAVGHKMGIPYLTVNVKSRLSSTICASF